jgi:hypothetical protein
MKKIFLLVALLGQACTETGPEFLNCSSPEDGLLAIDIAARYMEHASSVADRMNFSCKTVSPRPRTACYLVRTGDATFGNRGLIVMLDEYIGECIIHELYHAELGMSGDTCPSHVRACGWDKRFLEVPLNEYAAESGRQEEQPEEQP